MVDENSKTPENFEEQAHETEGSLHNNEIEKSIDESSTEMEKDLSRLDGEVKENSSESETKSPKKKEEAKRWYSLRVISGKEKKIKERIELELQRNGWSDFVTQILVPTEKVYKIRAGKKVILDRNILPGYILVQAYPSKFSGEIIQTITGMTNVIHFLGRNKPIPMQESEANRMLGKVDESQGVIETMVEPYLVGETVKIIDGPFKDFVGDVKEVNEEKKKLTVIVKIFGRGTEVELNFMQVEKQM